MITDQDLQRQREVDEANIEHFVGKKFHDLALPDQLAVWRLQGRGLVWVNKDKVVQKERRVT